MTWKLPVLMEIPDLRLRILLRQSASDRLDVISRCTALRVAHLINAGPLQNALDWAKDLVPGDGHVIGHIAKDGRLHKVPLLTCTTHLPSLLLTITC